MAVKAKLSTYHYVECDSDDWQDSWQEHVYVTCWLQSEADVSILNAEGFSDPDKGWSIILEAPAPEGETVYTHENAPDGIDPWDFFQCGAFQAIRETREEMYL